MRVLLKFEIDCDADAAWRAIHSPAVLSELYGALLRVSPIEATPTSWTPGDEAAMQLHAGGVLPLGKQLIHLSDSERIVDGSRVRILRDTGIPLSGPLAGLDVWDHQMAVSAVPGRPDRTLWRDRLVFDGIGAAAYWPALWAAWQWRELRIRQLAPTWAFDPPARDAADAD